MTKPFQNLKSFIVPNSSHAKASELDSATLEVVAIIPTYKPSDITYSLISSIIEWTNNVNIIVVDDCSGHTSQSKKFYSEISGLPEALSRIQVIRTPNNLHKVGALNYGLDHLNANSVKNGHAPDVVLTFDDDVSIEKNTIAELLRVLWADPQLGAVTTDVQVKNKKHNLLTRLQALEYHGFNILKLADNGFYQGPLVMQGMLTAFRYTAIIDVNGYTAGQLIEDYDITAKLKRCGWSVSIAPKSLAWTEVPEDFGVLWRQRVRWTYNGLKVVKDFINYIPSVIQDLIGHTLFISTIALIVLSFILNNQEFPSAMIFTLTLIAVSQFFISYLFYVYSLRFYRNADTWDWVIKFLILPEHLYSMILSLVLVGSYFFFIYNSAVTFLISKFPVLSKLSVLGYRLFGFLGYTENWATRATLKEVTTG